MKLNLACGKTKLEGWLNVDISEQVNPDLTYNILIFPWLKPKPTDWPEGTAQRIEDGEVDEIFCSHFVEHIGDELISFMDEAWRVLKPGGTFRIVCPYYTSVRAVQDPTHKRFISEHMFHYFSAAGRKKLGVEHYPIKADFDIDHVELHMPMDMQEMDSEERKWLIAHAWNTAADIEVLLKKHDPNQQAMD